MKVSSHNFLVLPYISLNIVCVSLVQQKLNTDNREIYGKTKIVTRCSRTCMHLHASDVGIQFLCHNSKVFIFDAEFPYKGSYFKPFYMYLPAKMVAKTMTRFILEFDQHIIRVWKKMHINILQVVIS